MNIERMTALRNALAEGQAFNGKLHFNMGTFIEAMGLNYVDDARKFLGTTESCGTSGCLAGWTCLLFGEDGDQITGDNAAALLGLDLHQAERLFFNRGGYMAEDAWRLDHNYGTDELHYRSLKDITVAEGVAALDRMIREGRNG